MNLKRILDLYEIIKNRLPSTYPRPKLAFHEDEDSMLVNNDQTKADDEITVFAVANPNTTTISLPMKMNVEYINKAGLTVEKTVPLTKQTDDEIANTLLHEICHLWAGDRYGYSSKQYSDEKFCDNFAKRWVKILQKEKLI